MVVGQDERAWMLQGDVIEWIKSQLGAGQWAEVRLYSAKEGREYRNIQCALIPDSKVQDVLRTPDLDHEVGIQFGYPGFQEGSDPDDEDYLRHGNTSGFEPLVFLRFFSGIKPSCLEVSEEFRLLYNLYHDRRSERLVAFDESGDEETIVDLSGDGVKVKLRELKRFLATKKMHLALYFTVTRLSPEPLPDIGLKEDTKVVHGKDLIYRLALRDWEGPASYGEKSFSELLGKKLLGWGARDRKRAVVSRPLRKYESFIVGTTKTGNPIEHSCDPARLRGRPGNRRAEAHELTGVFFAREVLTRYYENPARFTVEDGVVQCDGFWTLSIDNNHREYVFALLSHLGTHLPYKEQLYWKRFNIPPAGPISRVHARRAVNGEWALPEMPDHLFKYNLGRFQEKWQERFGWPLFKPLRPEDSHYLKTLRVPLTSDQKEFDDQVLALGKILIDSLNEKEIGTRLRKHVKDEKGITKLARFIGESGVVECEFHIKFLRDLYDLRHGTAHRKGKAYGQAARVFGLQEKGLIKCFSDILASAIDLLRFLEMSLLQSDLAVR